MKAVMDWELYEELLSHIENEELRQQCFMQVSKFQAQACRTVVDAVQKDIDYWKQELDYIKDKESSLAYHVRAYIHEDRCIQECFKED